MYLFTTKKLLKFVLVNMDRRTGFRQEVSYNPKHNSKNVLIESSFHFQPGSQFLLTLQYGSAAVTTFQIQFSERPPRLWGKARIKHGSTCHILDLYLHCLTARIGAVNFFLVPFINRRRYSEEKQLCMYVLLNFY